jgi:phage I-like protein
MKKLMAKVILAEIEMADGQIPEWFIFFEEGWIEIEGEGKALVDRQAYEKVAAYFMRRGNDIVIDYEHQTVEGVKAPAAGWIKAFRYTDGVGIEAQADWTEEAKSYIEKGEYRYFSPVFLVRNSDKRVIAVHSVALTNAPKINHLTPILAKLGEDFREEETNMDFLKKLVAKLGLDAGADEDKVVEAVEAVVAKAGKGPEQVEVVAKDVLQALDLTEGDASTVVASIHALKQSTKGAVSREEFDRLQKDLNKRDADEVVAKAVLTGKVTADQKEWADEYALRDLEGFKTFVAKAPVVIPVKELPNQKEKGDGVIDETVLNVAKMMGNTEEDLKQYGGLHA